MNYEKKRKRQNGRQEYKPCHINYKARLEKHYQKLIEEIQAKIDRGELPPVTFERVPQDN